MPQQPCIYAITNSITGSCYVGSAVDFETRKSRHLRELRQGKHHSSHLQRSYLKHGESAFTFSILEKLVKDKQLLFERESYWIGLLKPTYNVGQVNHTLLGTKRTEEVKQRMSEKAALRTHTEESKAKMAEKKRDRKLSEETKQKMSQSRTGRTFTEEQRQRISESNKATRANWSEEQRKKATRSRKPISEETRQKMRDAKVDKKQSPEHVEQRIKAKRGVSPSEETREKMRISNKAAAQKRKDEGIQPRLHTEESRIRMSQIHKERWAKKKAQQAETLNIQQPKLFE